jgi:hypothetical protein
VLTKRDCRRRRADLETRAAFDGLRGNYTMIAARGAAS